MAKKITQELIEAVKPHKEMEIVYVNKDGEWHFSLPDDKTFYKGFETVTVKEILASEKK